MFASLTYEDKEAFFSLLDEYFESRPHLVGSSSSYGAAISPPAASPVSTRSMPPQAPPLASYNSSSSARSPPPQPPSRSGRPEPSEKPDMTTRLVIAGLKTGTSGARATLGLVAKNKGAMAHLDEAGMGGIVRGVDKTFNPNKKRNQQPAEVQETAAVEAASPPPAPAPTSKKGGVSGLVSSKNFGHVDTSSGMSAFKSMWKDPQKVKPPVVEHPQTPALTAAKGNGLPPPRRNAPVAEVIAVEEEVITAEGQVQALYDYNGSDESDLPVQKNQIVNLIERTSEDWWTCEDGNGRRGLVPSTYLKQL